jgi:hypothetical protein
MPKQANQIHAIEKRIISIAICKLEMQCSNGVGTMHLSARFELLNSTNNTLEGYENFLQIKKENLFCVD